MIQFEHLVFGWARHGFGSGSGFQIVAATPRLTDMIRQRHYVAERALELSGWESAPGKLPDAVLGWRVDPDDTYVWYRKRLGSPHWAATGSYLMHLFHTRDVPNLADIMALVGPDRLNRAEEMASRGTELPTVKLTSASSELPGDPSIRQIAVLLIGVALSRAGASAATISAPSTQMIDALRIVADVCPLPIFAERNLTTSAPLEAMRSYAISGGGTDLQTIGRLPVPCDSIADLPTQTRAAAAAAVGNPRHARAALLNASTPDGLDAPHFEALLLFLVGETHAVTTRSLVKMLGHVVSAGIAFEQPATRAALVERFLREPTELGRAVGAAVIRDPNMALVARELATQAARHASIEPVMAETARYPAFHAAMISELVGALRPGSDAISSASPSTLTSLLAVVGRRSGGTYDIRGELVAGLAAMHVVPSELNTITERDTADLLHRWFHSGKTAPFLMALRQVSVHVLLSITDLLEDAKHRTRLDQWLSSDGIAAQRFIRTTAMQASSAVPAVWALCRLGEYADSATHLSLLVQRLDPRVLRALASQSRTELNGVAGGLLERRVMERMSSGLPASLDYSEQRLADVMAPEGGSAAQLHRTTTWFRRFGVHRQVGWSPPIAVLCSELINDGPVGDAIVAVLFGELIPRCASAQEISGVASTVAEVLQLNNEHTWSVLLRAATNQARRRSNSRSHLATLSEALELANRNRAFGLTQSLRSPPRTLRDIVERTA